MPELQTLNPSSFPLDHPVASNGDDRLRWRQFLSDIAATRAMIAARDTRHWALYESDRYHFAVALLALLAENRRVYLPGDNRRASIDALAAEGVQFCGDFPSTEALPSICSGSEASATPLAVRGELVIFTSGSTGAPKAIVKQLAQIDAELAGLEQQWGERLGNSFVAGTVSHQHFYGLLFTVLWPLTRGRCFHRYNVIDPAVLAQQTLSLAKGQRIAWVMSPAHLHRLDHAALPWEALKARVAVIFSSGGPLQKQAALDINSAFGTSPVEVLGSSETGGIAWREQSASDSNWTPLPGIECRANGSGALEIRSPCLAQRDWYSTADAVQTGSDGRFRLLDRIDRIVKVEGRRVALAQVEGLLLQSPLLTDCTTLMLRRQRQTLAAVITLSEEGLRALDREGLPALARQLRTPLLQALPAVAVPRLFRPSHEIARNAQGKVSQQALAQAFEPGRLPHLLAVEQRADGLALTLHLPSDLHYFAGHFPAAPILPGVVQIHWAAHYARRYLGMHAAPRDMKAVKFQNLARPGMVLHLSLKLEGQYLAFQFQSRAGQHSQGRLYFGSARA